MARIDDWSRVRRLQVVATVTFEAYGIVQDGIDPTGRVESEIRDAVQYAAPHLSDTDEGDDVLVAPVGGGGLEAVTVKARVMEMGTADPAAVLDAIESTEAWT